MKGLKVFIATYIVSTLIRLWIGFDYKLFGESFDGVKFAVDFALWTITYGAGYFILSKVLEKKAEKNVIRPKQSNKSAKKR